MMFSSGKKLFYRGGDSATGTLTACIVISEAFKKIPRLPRVFLRYSRLTSRVSSSKTPSTGHFNIMAGAAPFFEESSSLKK